MIDAATRGDDIEPLRARITVVSSLCRCDAARAFETIERSDLHALLWAARRTTESAAAEAFADLNTVSAGGRLRSLRSKAPDRDGGVEDRTDLRGAKKLR